MRMWMINPKLMCLKHILGEHAQIHRYYNPFSRHYNIDKRIQPIVMIEPQNMKKRHDRLEEELNRRRETGEVKGLKKTSPYILPDLSYLPQAQREAKMDKFMSMQALMERCPVCKERIMKLFNEKHEVNEDEIS